MTSNKTSQYLENFSFIDKKENNLDNNLSILTENNIIYNKIDRLLSIDNADTNAYLDSFRRYNKNYNLENKDDFHEVIKIIKKVSYLNITEYENRDYAPYNNNGMYDIFSINLTEENYKFLYNIFYKYSSDYIHDLYFTKHKYNEEKDECYFDFPRESCNKIDDNLALPIRSKFSEVINSENLNEIIDDEKYLIFLAGNLSEFDIENSDLDIDNFILLLDKNLITNNKYIDKIINI